MHFRRYMNALPENTVIFICIKSLSNMLELSESDVAVHYCTFQAYLEKAKVNLRFPSLFFVEWKSINGKNAVSMVGRKRAINSLIELNETLIFTTEMLFHRAQRQYLKKESLIHLNLISNSRPDQVKLVGRVVVDLSEIANTHRYSTVNTAKLMYCSVEAEVSFSMKLTRSIDSNVQLNELDRSSFSDLYSFTTSLKNTPRIKERKESSASEKKVDDERKKIKNRFIEREDIAIDMPKDINRQLKIENILIKESHQQANQERSLPNSLPLTEKKPPPILDADLPIQPSRPTFSAQAKKPVTISEFDPTIQRQKDGLERQLNQHKNRIKKLETDIKEVLRLFEQSQQNSQLNKSKLIQSQEVINSLRDTQAKIKQYYEIQLANIKEANNKQLDLLRSGYEADIKIFKATIEQQRLKTSQQQQTNQKIIQEYQAILKQNEDVKAVLKDQQEKFSNQLTLIKQQNMNFHSAKESILASIDQKQSELNRLQNENLRLKQEIQIFKKKQGSLALQLKNEVVAKNTEIETLRTSINNTINQIQNDLKSKSTELYEFKLESQAKLEQTIFQYQHKLLQSAQEIEKLKKQNNNLLQDISNKSKQTTLNNQINPNDTISLQNYQKLRQQHNKLTALLQNLKKSIIFPQQELRLYQQAQNIKPDLFVIMERSQLQEIQISELKLENATMREKMGQLVEEHEQLKNSRNKEEPQTKPVIDELQLQQINLVKEQLANSKDLETALLETQRKLEQQINCLNGQLASAKTERNSLKQENQRSTVEINNLKGEIKMHRVSFNSSEDDMGISLKPQQAINIKGGESNINIELKKNPQSETVRLNIEIGRLQSLEDIHNDAPIQHEHHDFIFDEHLTHEQLNKISELKDVHHDDEINYLRTENTKLKEEIEELKFIKQSLAQNAIEQPQTSLKLLEIQDKLRRIEQENQSLKYSISIPNVSKQKSQSEPQPNEQLSNKLLVLQDELHQSKKVIAEFQSHLTELQKKNEDLSRQGQTITGHQQKESAHIRELEAKLVNLEQELKIKDEILVDGERTIEQNYAIKYELAELKQKYSEIKSALDERDEMINYLQETKQQLSKELEQVVDRSHPSAFHIELKYVPQQVVSTPTFEVHPSNQRQLNGQIQALKKELISLNNNNIELRSQLQEFANQKLAMGRVNQQNGKKIMQIETQKRELQAQINDYSLLINAQSQQSNKLSIVEKRQIQKIATEMQKISGEMHQLRANYTNLVGQSTLKQQKIAMLQRQNQLAKQKIDELTLMTQKMSEQQDHQFQIDLPQVHIHEVDSFNEATSLEYQHSVIPLQDQSNIKINETTPILPPPDSENLHVVIDTLQERIDKLTNQLNKQASQKDNYYNHLEISNNKILDLQAQVVIMKDQIDKLSSLPIQSFAVSTARNKHQYETFSKNMRETSIMYQPRVRGEASMSQASTPQKHEFSKGEFSKDVQTRVQTNVQTKVIKETEAELLQQELDMLKEQLESQAKLHHELRQIHSMCEKKYELLNNHHENCLEQLQLFKNQNEGLVRQKQNMTHQLYFLKEELQRMQNQQEEINIQYAKFLKNNQNAEQNEFSSPNQEAKDQQSMEPKLFLQFKQSSNKQSIKERQQFTKKQQEFISSCQKYQKTIADLRKNEQMLIKKINLLEENMFGMQKALQQQIQINQDNDKITQKLEQLNELQSLASQFQQQFVSEKTNKQQLEILKEQNNLLIRQKEQLMKTLQEHALCIEERAEWQQKLQNIEHMLMNSENKFAEQKQELENKVLILNEEKANLQAQRTIIYQNIKKGSEIMIIDNPAQQINQKQNELYAELQAVRNEKLSQMQKVVDLQTKLNQESEQKVKKVAQLQEALIAKDHEIQQSRFISIQLQRQIQEIRVQQAEKDLYDNKKGTEMKKVTQENATLIKEVTILREKIEQSLNALHQKDLQIKGLQQQIVFLSANATNNDQLTNISAQIAALRQEVVHKIASIEVLEHKLRENQSQINNLRSQLVGKVESLRLCEEKLQFAEEDIQRAKNENNQLLKIKAQLEKQVGILNGRYSELQKAVKNTATSKDKNTQLLKGQISKKDQQITELSKKIRSKQNDILSLSKQLDDWRISSQRNQLKIQQLAQKQKLMKQTMLIIEKEAQKVVQSLKSRYESQEIYYRKFIEKERENNRLNLALTSAKEEIANKDRTLLYEQQKLSQLQSDLELLKRSNQGDQIPSKIVTIQYQKYQKLMEKNDLLMNKNRQYLQIISHKTTVNLESERLKNEIKQVQQKLDEHQQTSLMAQQIIESKLPQLEKQLESANNERQDLIQTISSLRKDIQIAKQQITQNNHKLIENLLQEKEKQINLLKQNVIKKGKQFEPSGSLMEEPADSNISILNQQILNLNREILEKDNQLQRIKADMRKNKSHVVAPQPTIVSTTIDEEKIKLINEIQERERRQQQYKENIDILKEQLKREKYSFESPQKHNRNTQGTNIENIQVISHDLHSLCQQIKILCQKRSSNDESDKLFQSFAQKYDLMEEQFNNLNTETSFIQQKAKFISKQLQKVKSFIIKGQNRAFKEKTQLLALIKPCEIAASELVNISETLSQKESQNFI